MTDDEMKDAVANGSGAPLGASLIGGVLAHGAHEIDKLVFCEDCGRWDSCTPNPPPPTVVRIGRCLCDSHVYEAGGPLWPGCRGFKLRDGALGPEKRYAAAVKTKTAAVFEEIKRRSKAP